MSDFKDNSNKKAHKKKNFLRVGAIFLAALMIMSFVVMFIQGLGI